MLHRMCLTVLALIILALAAPAETVVGLVKKVEKDSIVIYDKEGNERTFKIDDKTEFAPGHMKGFAIVNIERSAQDKDLAAKIAPICQEHPEVVPAKPEKGPKAKENKPLAPPEAPRKADDAKKADPKEKPPAKEKRTTSPEDLESMKPEDRKALLAMLLEVVKPENDMFARLGIWVQDTEPCKVYQLRAPALDAGVQEGDIIQKYNDRPIANAAEFADMLWKGKAGDKVTLEILRGDKKLCIELALAFFKGEQPEKK